MNENNNESKTFPALTGEPASAPPAPYPISALSFRFAKTLRHIPHEYVVRSPENEDVFTALFAMIGEHGVDEKWGRFTYRYYYAGDGWKYWRMPANNFLINRALEDSTYHPDPKHA